MLHVLLLNLELNNMAIDSFSSNNGCWDFCIKISISRTSSVAIRIFRQLSQSSSKEYLAVRLLSQSQLCGCRSSGPCWPARLGSNPGPRSAAERPQCSGGSSWLRCIGWLKKIGSCCLHRKKPEHLFSSIDRFRRDTKFNSQRSFFVKATFWSNGPELRIQVSPIL